MNFPSCTGPFLFANLFQTQVQATQLVRRTFTFLFSLLPFQYSSKLGSNLHHDIENFRIRFHRLGRKKLHHSNYFFANQYWKRKTRFHANIFSQFRTRKITVFSHINDPSRLTAIQYSTWQTNPFPQRCLTGNFLERVKLSRCLHVPNVGREESI